MSKERKCKKVKKVYYFTDDFYPSNELPLMYVQLIVSETLINVPIKFFF